MRLFFISITFLFLVAFSARTAIGKTKADLAELSQRGAQTGDWIDAYGHLNDAPPSQRDPQWESLVEKIASGYLRQVAGDREDGDKIAKKVLREFPSLRHSASFMETLVDVSFKALQRCFGKGYQEHECTLRIIGLVKTNTSNTQLAMEAGDLIANKFDAAEALYVLKYAITPATRQVACKKDTVRNAVAKAFQFPEGEMAAIARGLASKDCWEDLKPTVEAALETHDGFSAQNACSVLKERGALSETQAAKCQSNITKDAPPPK